MFVGFWVMGFKTIVKQLVLISFIARVVAELAVILLSA